MSHYDKFIEKDYVGQVRCISEDTDNVDELSRIKYLEEDMKDMLYIIKKMMNTIDYVSDRIKIIENKLFY